MRAEEAEFTGAVLDVGVPVILRRISTASRDEPVFGGSGDEGQTGTEVHADHADPFHAAR